MDRDDFEIQTDIDPNEYEARLSRFSNLYHAGCYTHIQEGLAHFTTIIQFYIGHRTLLWDQCCFEERDPLFYEQLLSEIDDIYKNAVDFFRKKYVVGGVV